MFLLVGLLLLVLIVFGISSAMGSYATAQQARATAEVAEAAKVSAWGNLIVILVLALLIVSVLAFVVWMTLRRIDNRHTQTSSIRPRMPRQTDTQPQIDAPDINMMISLMTLKALIQMSGSTSPQVEEHDLVGENELEWLRQR